MYSILLDHTLLACCSRVLACPSPFVFRLILSSWIESSHCPFYTITPSHLLPSYAPRLLCMPLYALTCPPLLGLPYLLYLPGLTLPLLYLTVVTSPVTLTSPPRPPILTPGSRQQALARLPPSLLVRQPSTAWAATACQACPALRVSPLTGAY
jgi:hypothetical protein